MPLDISTGAESLSLYRFHYSAASHLRGTAWRSRVCNLKDVRSGPVVAVDDNDDVCSLSTQVESSFSQELSNRSVLHELHRFEHQTVDQYKRVCTEVLAEDPKLLDSLHFHPRDSRESL